MENGHHHRGGLLGVHRTIVEWINASMMAASFDALQGSLKTRWPGP
jgi:hypothetical protein